MTERLNLPRGSFAQTSLGGNGSMVSTMSLEDGDHIVTVFDCL